MWLQKAGLRDYWPGDSRKKGREKAVKGKNKRKKTKQKQKHKEISYYTLQAQISTLFSCVRSWASIPCQKYVIFSTKSNRSCTNLELPSAPWGETGLFPSVRNAGSPPRAGSSPRLFRAARPSSASCTECCRRAKRKDGRNDLLH